MRLYKILTTKSNELAKPDLDSVISFEDLKLNILSLPLLKKSIQNEGEFLLYRESFTGIYRQMNSNDIVAIRDNGRTLVYRFDDGKYLWIVDIDHVDYIRFKRDTLLESILN